MCLALVAFACGWLGTSAVRAAPAAFAAYLAASERKYLTMTGAVGPVTFLVDTADASALADAARRDDSVLGLEPHDSASRFAIAFVDAGAPGIRAVRDLPGTLSMHRRRIPMICH